MVKLEESTNLLASENLLNDNLEGDTNDLSRYLFSLPENQLSPKDEKRRSFDPRHEKNH